MQNQIEFNIKFRGQDQSRTIECSDFVMVSWAHEADNLSVAVHCSAPGADSDQYLVGAANTLASAMANSQNPETKAMGALMQKTLEVGLQQLEAAITAHEA
jgi:hypothetical protein